MLVILQHSFLAALELAPTSCKPLLEVELRKRSFHHCSCEELKEESYLEEDLIEVDLVVVVLELEADFFVAAPEGSNFLRLLQEKEGRRLWARRRISWGNSVPVKEVFIIVCFLVRWWILAVFASISFRDQEQVKIVWHAIALLLLWFCWKNPTVQIMAILCPLWFRLLSPSSSDCFLLFNRPTEWLLIDLNQPWRRFGWMVWSRFRKTDGSYTLLQFSWSWD